MAQAIKPQSSAEDRKTVFVVNVDAQLRRDLAQTIHGEADLMVSGEEDHAETAMQAIDENDPDILITDFPLQGVDGLDLFRTLRLAHPKLCILLVSAHDESVYAERALRAGANGYMMKQEAREKILVALRRILAGYIYVSERISNKLLHQYLSEPAVDMNSRFSTLSDRELEIFRLIGAGRSTRQIAEILYLSIKTVETYQAHIKDKLALRSGRELIQHATQAHDPGEFVDKQS